MTAVEKKTVLWGEKKKKKKKKKIQPMERTEKFSPR